MLWEKLEQGGSPPLARSSHSVTCVGSKLWLWGGEHEPRHPIDSVMFTRDLGTSAAQWEEVQVSGEPPSPRIAHAAAAVVSCIYLFGGRTGVDMGEGALGDLHRFDTATRSWEPVEPSSGAAPPPRSYHAAAAQGSTYYVFGGCGAGGRLNDLWAFDSETQTWRELPSSPAIKGRGGAGLLAVPGALLVLGGFSGQEMRDVHRFDLSTEAWEEVAAGGCTFPARSVFACAAWEGDVVVFGGEVDPSDKGHAGAGQFTNLTHCLSVKEREWRAAEPGGEAPCPRGWLAATACPEGVVISGGNSDANERLGDLYLLKMRDS